MTMIPHLYSYDTIKQYLVINVFKDEKLDSFISGTSKEKFQDGSGISDILKIYTQEELIKLFEEIYGIKKTSYLTS